jgi:hypothetical protein
MYQKLTLTDAVIISLAGNIRLFQIEIQETSNRFKFLLQFINNLLRLLQVQKHEKIE